MTTNDSTAADKIIAALGVGTWSTADLVRIAHAVAWCGTNTTAVLGQYGEELVARAFEGTIAPFDQKAYDVSTPEHGDLQVKTYSLGKRPGAIRSFAHDVIVLQVEPTSARVRSAKRYRAADLYAVFRDAYESKFASKWAWGGNPADRFERGWHITVGVPSEDVTSRFDA
jgi:hypothetical protein